MSGDVQALDAKVAELCWSKEWAGASLITSTEALMRWGQENDWPTMSAEWAQQLLLEESRTRRLKPVPPTPRQDALEVIGDVLDADSEQAIGPKTAEAVLKALEAKGLMITRFGRP